MLTVEFLPGDPVALMLGENARPEQVEALRRRLGLDQPLPLRYATYLARVAQGDLGRSIRQGRPVLDEIAEVWPQTIQLTLAAMSLAVVVGMLVGVVSAVRPYGWLDGLVRLGS